MEKKRGQVTLFIIIGIVMLIGFSFFIYYRNILLPEPDIVPEELMPIKNYIQTCLDTTGEKAVVKLGRTGGYINLPDEISNNKEAHIALTPNGLMKIPYWYYNGKSLVPSIAEMERQISNYIRDNILDCADLDVFRYEFDIEEQDPEVKTTINKEDVDIDLEYTLIITDKGTGETTKLEKFKTTLPVRLKKSYELARRMMEAENSKMYMENITIDLMSMNNNIPMTDLKLHCGELTWNINDIKDELKSIVYWNIPHLRVKNTDYTPFLEDEKVYEKYRKYNLDYRSKGNFPDDEPQLKPLPEGNAPADAYEYFHYLLDVRQPKTGLKAGFYYNPDWDMKIVARPSENGILRSSVQQGQQQYLSFMCINFYHFTYDVQYPVEISVRDDEAFNNNGFVFRYIMPVLISHNEGNRVDFGTSVFSSFAELSPDCNGLGDVTYEIKAVGTEAGYTGLDLNNVNITYDCIKYRCKLGKTRLDGGIYRLVTRLPAFCSGGFIVAEKEGYLKSKTQVTDSTSVEVNMRKLKTFNFDVMKKKYSHEKTIGDIHGLDDVNMSALIILQSKDDRSFVQYKNYPFEEDATQADKTIQLIDSEAAYDLSIFLYDNVKNLFIGGYKGEWTVNYGETAGNNIQFNVVEYLPRDFTPEGEAKVITFLENNLDYKLALRPEIK